jgi:hypothetical protein
MATGPKGGAAAVLLPPMPESHARVEASRRHAALAGLEVESVQTPIESALGDEGRTLHLLLEAALRVRQRGGGEVIWPVSGFEGEVASIARAYNTSLLLSQLATLATGSPGPAQVTVKSPYADLTGSQLVDLVLDMAAPIWMCWWMMPTAAMDHLLREEALSERAKWSRLLQDAGWTGSLEAKAASIVVRPAGSRVQGV